MRRTGMVRKVDSLGRIVIPKEIRRILDWENQDGIEIYVDEDRIVLEKHQFTTTCLVTGEHSFRNHVFADGRIVLSEEGITQLLEEIKTRKK